METTVATEPTLPPVVFETGESHGTEVFFYTGTSFPVGLGYPRLSDEEIDALIEETDYAKVAEVITTLADAAKFYDRMNFQVDRSLRDPSDGQFTHSRSAWQVMESKVFTWPSAASLTHYLLADDYDEVGYIWLSADHRDSTVMVYIYEDGLYYLIEPIAYVMDRPSGGWLGGFTPDLIAAAEDFQTIADSLVANENLGSGFPIDQVYLIRSSGDFVTGGLEKGKDFYQLFPVGTEVTEYYGNGFGYQVASLDWQSQTRMVDLPKAWQNTQVISFAGTILPDGLGKPVLSDENIDALIAEGDYEKIAQTITTFPDAVNFFLRAGITYNYAIRHNMINGFNYHRSAWQVLKDGYGQCVELSNLMHYLLLDDFDEIGYVAVKSTRNAHVMVYIIEDGLYYLIDPSQYGTPTPPIWPGYCSEDFMDIAEELTKSFILAGDTEPVNSVRLVKMPGDFVASSASDKVEAYPIGAEVIPYVGGDQIIYREANFEWDTHTRMDD